MILIFEKSQAEYLKEKVWASLLKLSWYFKGFCCLKSTFFQQKASKCGRRKQFNFMFLYSHTSHGAPKSLPNIDNLYGWLIYRPIFNRKPRIHIPVASISLKLGTLASVLIVLRCQRTRLTPYTHEKQGSGGSHRVACNLKQWAK